MEEKRPSGHHTRVAHSVTVVLLRCERDLCGVGAINREGFREQGVGRPQGKPIAVSQLRKEFQAGEEKMLEDMESKVRSANGKRESVVQPDGSWGRGRERWTAQGQEEPNMVELGVVVRGNGGNHWSPQGPVCILLSLFDLYTLIYLFYI